MDSEFVKALGIKAGDAVRLRAGQRDLRITTLKDRVALAQRHLRRYIKPGRSLVKELIAERRAAAERDKGSR
jgi:hypothetical protein